MLSTYSAKHPYAIAFASIPAAIVLTYVPHIASVLLSPKKVDLFDPRAALDVAPAESITRRLRCCHTNSLEVFPIFAASVLLAYSARVDAQQVDKAAALWLLLRIVYSAAYIGGSRDRPWAPKLRGLSWFFGTAITLYLGVKAFKRMI
ncbi:MAG: MAPEG family protein [archaeon]|nr:MAPEG family protein [archaeon]